jgi:hypothetical protein
MSRVLGLTAGTDAARARTGEYWALHKYLLDRYADRLVLTFAQIEDLLGFPLPASARQDRTWWGVNDPAVLPSPHVASWTLAGRTATINLPARIVLFERQD